MTDFVIGCTHFGHANIIKLADRLENWNSVVRPQDTVYHLGDFSYRAAKDIEKAYVSKLNGRLVRIQGNHDPAGWGTDYLSVRCNKVKVVLFHYPIEEWDGWWKVKVVLLHYPIEEWDGWWGGAVHLHCHTHKTEFVSGERRGNVGADATGFTPMRLEEAVDRLIS